MKNPLRCSFPDCDCFRACDDYRVRPVHCPEENVNALHHRVFSWLDDQCHRPTAGSREDVPGVRGAAHGLADSAVDCTLYMRAALGETITDDTELLHRRVLAVLAGLAIGSVVVLVYALVTS